MPASSFAYLTHQCQQMNLCVQKGLTSNLVPSLILNSSTLPALGGACGSYFGNDGGDGSECIGGSDTNAHGDGGGSKDATAGCCSGSEVGNSALPLNDAETALLSTNRAFSFQLVFFI